ncbi:hypothetical protein C475_06700 [Halosimplex carlsbadense 2-9-1]|uniref:Uncharacterized protein n=1 Tax=Halosimplex carlsbadense 2-9-1 TaxID=797114 RepID=M0CY97_9EURY|nr:hypothetical protein [Halosimplex carlsbadense]ELZ27588.1 hypothetical protein C475_06700 [Halosimplex carlsbadense 2-9-1]
MSNGDSIDPLVAFARRFGAPADRTDAAELVEALGEGEAPTDGFADALAATVADLDAEDENRRRAAARTLYEVAGVAPGPVCERGTELVAALDDPAARPYVAGALTTALEARGSLGTLVEDLSADAGGPSPSAAAVRYLSWIAKSDDRTAAAAESAVTEALTADDPAVREHASRFFAVAWEHRVAGREAAPALLDLTGDPNPKTRAHALTAVAHRVFADRDAGESPLVDPSGVVAAADEHLADEDRVRFNAVAALSESQHRVEEAGTRYWSDYADPELASGVVATLVDCLAEESEALRERVARVIEDVADSSPELLAEHADMLVDYGWNGNRPGWGRVRRAVVDVSAAHPAAFVPYAAEFVDRVGTEPARDTILVTGNIALADSEAVAEAVEVFVDRFTAPVSPTDRRPVGRALASFGRADSDAVPDWVEPLATAAEADDRERRRLARRNPIQAIAATDPDAAGRVLETVCSRVDEPDPVAQLVVLSGVADVAPDAAEPGVETLAALVRDADTTAAASAVETLYGLVDADDAGELLEPARDPVDRRRDAFDERVRSRADAIVEAVDETDR